MKEFKFQIKTKYIILFAFCIVIAIIAPNKLKAYPMMICNLGLIYAILAYGLSIMLGMGGQLSFAGLALMGAGGYFVGNLSSGRLGLYMNPLLALIVGTLIFGVISYLIGLVLLKLKGTFFTFATIALVQVAHSFYQNYQPLFGGAVGINNLPRLKIFGIIFDNAAKWGYLLIFLVFVLGLVVERIRDTQLGRSLASIRDNEIAALTLGVNVYKTKVIAFTIAGMLAALAGGLYALHGRYVGADMFSWNQATIFIVMVMVGGVNSSVGIIIGALLVTILPETLRFLEEYLQLIYGITVILLMVFMPDGIVGIITHNIHLLKHKLKVKSAGKGGGVL